MRKQFFWMVAALLLFTLHLIPSKAAGARPVLGQDGGVTPSQLIDAVNALRLSYGLLPLSAHPVLMEVAQNQANILAGTEGSAGHARPDGITLGQQLIMMGYPLSGDLTLDGYRSENWVTASTVDEAIAYWLSDDPHTNTMLSVNRSDIGAGIAMGDQMYMVIDTALCTKSGQQQSIAYDILTGIPLTQAASAGGSAPASGVGLISEYIIPVHRSTARPDGDVFHKVQYGQTLWSIAVTYGTTIKNIRAWNNLGEGTTIYQGQVLLVQRAATRPPPPTETPIPSPTPLITSTSTPVTMVPGFPTMTIRPAATITAAATDTSSSRGTWVGILVMFVIMGGFAGAWMIRPSK